MVVAPKPLVNPASRGVQISYGNIEHNGATILAGASNRFEIDNSNTAGSFLSVSANQSRETSTIEADLGLLQGSRYLACHRQKLWWMVPDWGSTKTDTVHDETQFLLVRLHDDEPGAAEKYAVILPIISGAFRASINTNSERKLFLRIESGDPAIKASELKDICFIAVDSDPFRLIRDSFNALSERMQTFRTREHKSMPPALDQFGWCTWDAFYTDVDGPGILAGVKKLKEGGVPPKVLILDDGWQDTTTDPSAKKAIKDTQLAKLPPPSGVQAVMRVIGKVLKQVLHRIADFISGLAGRYRDNTVSYAKPDSLHVWFFRTLTSTLLRWPLRSHTTRTDEWAKRLASSKVGPRFLSTLEGGTFKQFIDRLKKDEGIKTVYCWHALLGYWSGVHRDIHQGENDAPSTNAAITPSKDLLVQSKIKDPIPSPGIAKIEPGLQWNACALNGIGMPAVEKAPHLFDSIHSYLASSNIDGVKVDGQAAVTMMGKGTGGSTKTTQSFVQAMEASVIKNFGTASNCINCMCHPTECLYSYKETGIARVSDDFYPRDEASHTTHIAHVAYNSIFMGEIVQPDWDMFQSKHPVAGLHAAARAVGGCAVYVSDRPGEHNFDVLKRLVLPDGSTLRAKLPGRPTRDTLFADVIGDGSSALKIWNHNPVNGVLGAFNIQGAAWDRKTRRNLKTNETPGSVEAVLRPSDVEALVDTDNDSLWVMWATHWTSVGALKATEKRVLQREHPLRFSLDKCESVVATIAKVRTACGDNGSKVTWAALGLEEMLNGGGAVLSVREKDAGGVPNVDAEVEVAGPGTLVLHCSAAPAAVLLDGQPVPPAAFTFDADQHTLRIPVTLQQGRASATVQVAFANALLAAPRL